MELKDAEGSKKRKRAEAGVKLASTSKRGGHGRGHTGGSNVDRAAMAKVAASLATSPVVAANLWSVVSLGPRPSVVGASTWPQNVKHF